LNKRIIGDGGESLAVDFLLNNNIKVIERNFYTRHGEIDLIYKDNGYLVFAEVKERTGRNFGNALEAITYRKANNILWASKVYIYARHIDERIPIRYDVIGINNGEITWIKNAFSF